MLGIAQTLLPPTTTHPLLQIIVKFCVVGTLYLKWKFYWRVEVVTTSSIYASGITSLLVL
jgi:hypothetical protein